MPLRPLLREQAWLLPPSLDELLPEEHPARFVAAFVDALEDTDLPGWTSLQAGAVEGAPAYHPQALLGVWIYGFMTGVRSSRKLEGACRDQLPFLWLTGWQHPDHNTLWRFYQAHRQAMRGLLKRTVRTAVQAGLVDLAVQAVDGTKVQGNATKDKLYGAKKLQHLLERTDQAIAELEAQNAGGDDPPPPSLPPDLRHARALRERVRAALRKVEAGECKQATVTDPDVRLMKGRQGFVAGYNAQAMVSPLHAADRAGLLITAAAVVTDPDDHAQLVPMLMQAEETMGGRAEVALADAGYHSGPNLAACAEREQPIIMPEAQGQAIQQPYHKESFVYEEAVDRFICPEGQPLRFAGMKRRRGLAVRRYRASGAVCRGCPAFGLCTKDRRQGRMLEVGPDEALLRRQRALMATEQAKAAYRLRKELPEPAFGVLKERQGARRFLLRGLGNVQAEWGLLAVAFNLRNIWCLAAGKRWTLPYLRPAHTSAAF